MHNNWGRATIGQYVGGVWPMTISAGIIATGGYLTGDIVDPGPRNTDGWWPRAGGGSRQVSLNGICIQTLKKWILEQVTLPERLC